MKIDKKTKIRLLHKARNDMEIYKEALENAENKLKDGQNVLMDDVEEYIEQLVFFKYR